MADAISPIKMVGAPGTLPPELQARAAQVAMQQQIAQAMLAQSMGMEAPVIQGPAGNPFARSVVNLAPLGKMAQSVMGYNKEAQAADDQAMIAAMGEQIRHADQASAFAPTQVSAPMGPPTPDTGEMQPGLYQPKSGMQIAQALLNSSHPANQQLGQEFLANQFGISKAMLATPEVMASLIGRGNIRPESIPGALTTDPLSGGQVVGKPENLRVMPSPEKKGPTEQTYTFNKQTNQFEATGGGGGAPEVRTPEEMKGKEALTSYFVDPEKGVLPQGYEAVRDFQKLAPTIGTMLKLTETAGMGYKADWITEARQLAKRLGISDDNVGQIRDLQTLIKYAIVPATEGAKGLTSRPSQFEFIQFLKAAAADPNVDPATARNVFRSFLVNGLNEANTHEQNLARAGGVKSVSDQVPTYSIKGLDKLYEDVSEEVQRSTGRPLNFRRNNAGVYHDEDVLRPDTIGAPPKVNPVVPPKAAPKTEPLPKGAVKGTIKQGGGVIDFKDMLGQ
jgi:hypothetical protein